MSLRRPYAAALGLAVIAAIVGLAISSSSKSTKPLTDKQIAALEAAAIQRVKLPASFVRVRHGCAQARCYTVDAPPSDVVPAVPRLLRSAGFQPLGSLSATEPVGLLEHTGWRASSDPMVVACRTIRAPNHTSVSECQEAGRVGQTLLNVLIEPEVSCNAHACAQKLRTRILAWAVTVPSST